MDTEYTPQQARLWKKVEVPCDSKSPKGEKSKSPRTDVPIVTRSDNATMKIRWWILLENKKLKRLANGGFWNLQEIFSLRC